MPALPLSPRSALTAALLVGLGACVAPPKVSTHEDFMAEATRVYPGEDPARVIRAAETVLRLSDPEDFDFDPSLSGFTARRPYFIYAVVATVKGEEVWRFGTSDGSEGVRAVLKISESGRAQSGHSGSGFRQRLASIPLYRLFWARLDYMLGRRPDWTTCDQARAALPEASRMDALGGLCGPTSSGRDAPAPPSLGKRPVAASEKARAGAAVATRMPRLEPEDDRDE